MFQIFLVLALVASVLADYPTPPPIYEATDYTAWQTEYDSLAPGSRRAQLHIPFTNDAGEADKIDMFRLDLVGDVYERGFAFGALMAPEI